LTVNPCAPTAPNPLSRQNLTPLRTLMNDQLVTRYIKILKSVSLALIVVKPADCVGGPGII
jgi:hypothetical protein